MSDWFASPLSWWQWLLFVGLPPAILALYFLKLKRQSLEVPSTYLWHQTLEDLHVNSLWQKLRHSLLLLLQLLLLALLMAACLRPNWSTDELVENRVILLVDTSASMSATDVKPTRLDEAKRQAAAILDRMRPRDAAMIISFSDRARVEQPFTTDQRMLRRRLAAIEPTQRSSDISEALRAAAGLANPGRSAESRTDTPAADPLPAEVFIFSDGRYRTIPDFSWGNLVPHYVAIGRADATNAGLVAFQCNSIPDRQDRLQALTQVENFADQPASLEISLFLDDTLLDAAQVRVEPHKTGGAEFTFDRPAQGTLRAELSQRDALDIDNVAFAAINPPDRPRVLLVSAERGALEMALSTEDVSQSIQLEMIAPSELISESYRRKAVDGVWQLIVYDGCQPEAAPKANAIYFGSLPPGGEWRHEESKRLPQIIDVDVSHPLMTFLDLTNVTIASGTPLDGPSGSHVLMEADVGKICLIAPRESFEDLVLGFGLTAADEQGQAFANTDWPIRLSFPIFVRNALQYLGGLADLRQEPTVRVAQAVSIRLPNAEPITVTAPDGLSSRIQRGADGVYHFQETDRVGIYAYEVPASRTSETRRFAVNLFDSNEGNLVPVTQLETTWNVVEAQAAVQTKRYDAWHWFALLALVVLILEWYIYNRRVYL